MAWLSSLEDRMNGWKCVVFVMQVEKRRYYYIDDDIDRWAAVSHKGSEYDMVQ